MLVPMTAAKVVSKAERVIYIALLMLNGVLIQLYADAKPFPNGQAIISHNQPFEMDNPLGHKIFTDYVSKGHFEADFQM